MDERLPSERFLMTVPKPIHDWLSNEAEKLGVTLQDRIRVALEEQKHIIDIAKKEEMPLKFQDELREKCYVIGKKTYDQLATERARLEIVSVSDNGSVLWVHNKELERDFIIPVLSKRFRPLIQKPKISMYDETIPETELNHYSICDAIRKLAELENKLLSICKDGDTVYEALPLKCYVWSDKEGGWWGTFRLCINSIRTPTMGDIMRVTS